MTAERILNFEQTGQWFDAFIGTPTNPWSKQEPMVKRTRTPIWVLIRYLLAGMTPLEVSELWGGDVTVQEVEAAQAYWQAFPSEVDLKFVRDE
ncbi:MAG: hypothetical protein NTZ05_16110 [Chloroflexi bacterium]|nr:hypothetical protein [Chloroflexota bacterium]